LENWENKFGRRIEEHLFELLIGLSMNILFVWNLRLGLNGR